MIASSPKDIDIQNNNIPNTQNYFITYEIEYSFFITYRVTIFWDNNPLINENAKIIGKILRGFV